MNENDVYEQVARYLGLKYRDAVWHFDLAGVNNTSKYTRALYARLNGRGFPDLFIAHPTKKHHGLFLEIKKDGVRLRKVKTGEWADKHIEEQAEVLATLNELGYIAKFAVGFDDAKATIDAYMGNKASNEDGKPF